MIKQATLAAAVLAGLALAGPAFAEEFGEHVPEVA